MTTQGQYQLTPEARALLDRLAQERDAALQRLDVAVLAMKAAMGVPTDYVIRSLDEGFVQGDSNGVDTHAVSNN